MLIPTQDLTVTRFSASYTLLNTTSNRKNAPANCLRIHQVLVEVCLFLFSCFWHYATLCLRPYCGSFCCLLGSFEHSCMPQKCSSKPFTNSSSPCGGISVSIFVLLPLCNLCSGSYYGSFRCILDLWILPHAPKMLQKTVYKSINSLWRYFCFDFRVFAIMLTSAQESL